MSRIQVGDALPNVSLYYLASSGPEPISVDELFTNKRVVLFALPGAFTPTCSKAHLPQFIAQADSLKKAGVDDIICVSVNDAWVMAAWGQQQKADAIRLLGDGSADFTDAIGMSVDRTASGMGVRSLRYAMIVDNGIVSWLAVDQSGLHNSSADAVLQQLTAMSR